MSGTGARQSFARRDSSVSGAHPPPLSFKSRILSQFSSEFAGFAGGYVVLHGQGPGDVGGGRRLGYRGVCGGAADRVGIVLGRVAWPAPGARDGGGHQGNRHGEVER